MLSVYVFQDILKLVPQKVEFRLTNDAETRVDLRVKELPANRIVSERTLGRSPIHPRRGHAAQVQEPPHFVYLTMPVANLEIKVLNEREQWVGHAFTPQEVEGFSNVHVTRTGVRVVDCNNDTSQFPLI